MSKAPAQYWLVRTEPDSYSIDDLKRDKKTVWDCVRNYQARNNLCAMEIGDQVIIYHSSSDPTGIAGLAKVSKKAFPDQTQFDKKSEYYDAKATKETPRWFSPEISYVRSFPELLTLELLRSKKQLEGLLVLKRGMRLSVQPVTNEEFENILALAD